jgi:PAS domain-containing protein
MGYGCSYQDITELINQTKLLRESERKYSLLFENMGQGIIYVDENRDDKVESVSYIIEEVYNDFEIISGISKEVAIGKDFIRLFPVIKDLIPNIYALYHEVLYTGEEKSFTIYSEVETSGLIFLFSPEEDKIAILFRDVTERILSQQRMKKMNSAIEQSSGMVTIIDIEGTIEYVNPKFTYVCNRA